MSKMRDTIITVYVDTAKIIRLSNKKKHKQAIMSCIIIGDNHYDFPDKEEFESRIHQKSKVSWVGAAMDIFKHEQDFVIIKKIIPKKNNKSIIKMCDSKKCAGTTHKDGYVGKVKMNQQEDYSIQFLVNSEGKEMTFKIDPKIRII
jgi:hypothetical protein